MLIAQVRGDCYQKWLSSYETYEEGSDRKSYYPMGEVLARIMSDSESIKDLLMSGTFTILFDFTVIISGFISFITLDGRTGGWILMTEFFACVLLIWGSKYMAVVYMEVRKAIGRQSRTLSNLTGGFSQIYYTPHQSYPQKKGEVVFSDFLKKQLKANIWDASYYSFAESLFPVLLIILVVLMRINPVRDLVVVGVLIDLIQRSINPIKGVAGKISNLQRSLTGISRMASFMDDLTKGMSSSDRKKIDASYDIEKIEIDVKLFEYENTTATKEDGFKLQNVYLEGRPSEMIGIAGTSGCGKSTLLSIICGQLIPKIGEIRIFDNKKNTLVFSKNNLSELPTYREYIGLVSQDSHVFTDSLKNNITMGHDSVDGSFEEFWEETIKQIPYIGSKWQVGPEDLITPDSLSMGQKQLISALRSCFLKRPIVLFDEISSGLDSMLEESLSRMIKILQKNSLIIVVAHRVETTMSADRIIVMGNGQVKDVGRHEQLLTSSITYQQFVAELSV